MGQDLFCREMESIMLIVETVSPEGIAHQSGIQPGDRLLSYAGQSLSSPALLEALEENTFTEEPVLLLLEREDQIHEKSLSCGKLGLQARPLLFAPVLSFYEQAKALGGRGQHLEAARQYEQAAAQAKETLAACWLLEKAGEQYEEVSAWQKALADYKQAFLKCQQTAEQAVLFILRLRSGNCYRQISDYDKAQDQYEQSGHLAKQVRWQMWLARSLHNLGNIAYDRGDLVTAHNDYKQSLNIREKLAPCSLDVAHCINNLGNVAFSRGDLATAQVYYTRALAIKERLVPDSLDVALSFNNLGRVAYSQLDSEAAQDYFARALAIQERLAPDSLDMAYSLGCLGDVAWQRGDLATAQDCLIRSLVIQEKLAPGSLEAAESLKNLGVVAYFRGDSDAAQDYFTRDLAITEKLAPGSLSEAESREQLGELAFRKQHYRQALSHFQQAVSILEAHRSQISATEARSLLLAQNVSKFLGLIKVYLALDQPEYAFTTLERIRARSLLELLAERQIDLSEEAPLSLLKEYQELDQQRSQAYQKLAELSISDEQQVQELHTRLHSLERQQQDLIAGIREASSRYAALQYPQPLDANAAQSALEAGTVLLSFLVAEEITYLFAVSNKEIDCYELAIGQNALQGKVQAFREALDVTSLENTLTEAIEQGRQLYEQLLTPALNAIVKAKRLLICADGPLHLLPFAALVVKTGKKPVYLGQLKPLHTTFSMTVYTQTRQAALSPSVQSQSPAIREKERTSQTLHKLGQVTSSIWQQGLKVLALGDPVYAADGRKQALARSRSARKKQADNQELTGLRSRGLSLAPLPHTRDEVQAIASLFGEQAIVRTGEKATKATAIKESEEADIIHFACHGWLDAQMPLSSGLILSQPEALGKKATEQDNGLLQAWEIFKLKLKAELVVLSACQTGLGAEIRGEGLIGLTRAFTYAGAKSVVVSLWEINDASTAMFMQAFYQAMKEGKSKDKALQQAIKKMSKQGNWQHPFFWSAFSLVGDWR